MLILDLSAVTNWFLVDTYVRSNLMTSGLVLMYTISSFFTVKSYFEIVHSHV